MVHIILKLFAITVLAFLVSQGEGAKHYVLSPAVIDFINSIKVGSKCWGDWVPASAALPAYGVFLTFSNFTNYKENKDPIVSIPTVPSAIDYDARAVAVVFGNEDVSVYGLLAAVFAYFHGFCIVGLHIREKNEAEKEAKTLAENAELLSDVKDEVKKAIDQPLKFTTGIETIINQTKVETASELVDKVQNFDKYADNLGKEILDEINQKEPELNGEKVKSGITKALERRRRAIVREYRAFEIISKLKKMLKSLGMTIFEETPDQYADSMTTGKGTDSVFKPFTNIIGAFDAIDEGNETHSPFLENAYFGLKELRYLRRVNTQIFGVGRASYEDNLLVETWNCSNTKCEADLADKRQVVDTTTDVIINGFRNRNMRAREHVFCLFVTPEPIKNALKNFKGHLDDAPFQPNYAWVTSEDPGFSAPDDVWDNPKSLLAYYKSLKSKRDE